MGKRKGPYAITETYLIRWVGTRGVILLIFGLMWVLLGFSFITLPVEHFSRPGPGGILDYLDHPPIAWIISGTWLVGGIVAIISAIQRPRTCEDGWGFIGVSLPPTVWGTCYFMSWMSYLFSHGVYGRPTAYIAWFIYTTMTFVVMFLSRNLQDHPEGPCARRRARINAK